METPNYYAVIPANVRYDKELNPMAKLLYGEISALTQKEGVCWATNNYFAELYDVDPRTIRRLIAQLGERGYIAVELVYKEGSKEVEQRKIWISKNVHTSGQNCQEGGDKDVHTPPDKNVLENNTSNNNIPPIVPQGDDMPKEDVRPYNFDILWQEYPKKEGKASAYRSYCSWLVGKKTPLGKRKLTNEEIDTAIQNYNNKIQKEHTEYKYIKQGSTFFNLGILDYLGDGTSD